MSIQAAGMIASMLNIHQPGDISYNVGIMPHNCATLDGGQDLRRRKELGQRREAGRGSWRTMRKKKSGFITLLGFGPIHLDETIGLGNVESVTYFFPDIGKFCL